MGLQPDAPAEHLEGREPLFPGAGSHMTLAYSFNTSWRPWRKLRGVQAVPVAAASCGMLTAAELPAAQGCPSQLWRFAAAQLMGCMTPMLPAQLLPAKRDVLAARPGYKHVFLLQSICAHRLFQEGRARAQG